MPSFPNPYHIIVYSFLPLSRQYKVYPPRTQQTRPINCQKWKRAANDTYLAGIPKHIRRLTDLGRHSRDPHHVLGGQIWLLPLDLVGMGLDPRLPASSLDPVHERRGNVSQSGQSVS